MKNDDASSALHALPRPAASQLAVVASFLLSSRRRRDAILDGVEFGEPAWDMLLDLYVEHARGRRVSTHNLCEAAMVPATTALRWIGAMVNAGQLSRQPDPSDRRRVFIAMTAVSLEAIERYLIRERDRMKETIASLY